MVGVEGGTAIAETVFGLNNPGGKLPYTVYPHDYIFVMWSKMFGGWTKNPLAREEAQPHGHDAPLKMHR